MLWRKGGERGRVFDCNILLNQFAVSAALVKASHHRLRTVWLLFPAMQRENWKPIIKETTTHHQEFSIRISVAKKIKTKKYLLLKNFLFLSFMNMKLKFILKSYLPHFTYFVIPWKWTLKLHRYQANLETLIYPCPPPPAAAALPLTLHKLHP